MSPRSALQIVSLHTPVPACLADRQEPTRLPPFHSWGLVFELCVRGAGDAAAELGCTNLPGDCTMWPAHGLPWGPDSDSEHACKLARRVVTLLRPDWRVSFWSNEFLEEVVTDFARRFLIPASVSGGHVSRGEINRWLESLGLSVRPLPTSISVASTVG